MKNTRRPQAGPDDRHHPMFVGVFIRGGGVHGSRHNGKPLPAKMNNHNAS